MEFCFIDEMSKLMEKGRFFIYLAYILDSLFERVRYLVGAQWSSFANAHVYCGIPIDNITKAIKAGGI